MDLAVAVFASFLTGLAAAPGEALTVQAPDSPVRVDHARVFVGPDGPPVLLYAASNVTDDQLDEFTVMAFVFRDGVLKARQIAPGRRTLDAHTTKYSAIILDGIPIEPNDVIVLGVNQAQRAGSSQWWRADLQPAAEAAVSAIKRPKP